MYILFSIIIQIDIFIYKRFRHLREASRQLCTFHRLWPLILCTKQAQDGVSFADSSSQRRQRKAHHRASAVLYIMQVRSVSG